MIDIYCLTCYFSVALVLAEYAIVLLLRDRVQKEEVYKREKKVRLLFSEYNLHVYGFLPNINHSGEADEQFCYTAVNMSKCYIDYIFQKIFNGKASFFVKKHFVVSFFSRKQSKMNFFEILPVNCAHYSFFGTIII